MVGLAVGKEGAGRGASEPERGAGAGGGNR